MKSPDALAATLCRQWQDAKLREQRLLDPAVWPLQLPIGKPTPTQMERDTPQVRSHIQQWRAVTVGKVQWQQVPYRSAAEPIALPTHWQIADAREWALASADTQVQHEARRLLHLLPHTDARFHRLLIRQRNLWRDKDDASIITAARLALALEPGIAAGAPLRTLALGGIDSKFIERNASLVSALLDIRFDGAVSEQGLETFLGGTGSGEHWLLVVPLSSGLLPFTRLRVRASELQHTPLPATHILLIENERCLHHLPPLPDTIAILGSGADLAWLQTDWLRHCRVGYWGDMDTWGLQLLARARRLQPHLHSLLMEHALFDQCAATLAVPEPSPADATPPPQLDDHEQAFYRHLLGLAKGRIEQEFLPVETVAHAMRSWHACDHSSATNCIAAPSTTTQ